MKGGYKILWTDHALSELEKTIEYVKSNFSNKQVEKLSQKIESIVYLISQNPALFSKSHQQGIYKVTILKFNTMYYRIQGDNIEILSFFSNRQDPQKRKLLPWFVSSRTIFAANTVVTCKTFSTAVVLVLTNHLRCKYRCNL